MGYLMISLSQSLLPLLIIGLFWRLVVLEGQESESESLATLTVTGISLATPPAGFSEDESSGMRTNQYTEMNQLTCRSIDQWSLPLCLCLPWPGM